MLQDPSNHQIQPNHASQPLAAPRRPEVDPRGGGGGSWDPSIHPSGRAVEVPLPVPSRSTRASRRRWEAAASGASRRLVLARVSTPPMESPPPKLNVRRDEDRISALPDELLLRILERLGLRDAVRAGAVSTRWRHLPHQLSVLILEIRRFRRATLVETMDAFTGALMSVCPPAERSCECQRSRVIEALHLRFYLSAPHLSPIGSAVQDVVSRGKTKRLAFRISPQPADYTATQLAEFGQQFMSFSRAYQIAFRWLTRLTLENLAFGDSDVTDLITACVMLKRLTLNFCELVDEHSALKIDTPCSELQQLEFIHFVCMRIELISVPKLSKVRIEYFESPPVYFGYVPELCDVSLSSTAGAWLAPFALSDCLPRAARNMSTLCLNFHHQMIWIKPEHPKQLTRIFRNLTDVYLFGIFPECDLSWTLFILEAAPALSNLTLSRTRHSYVEALKSGEKTNVVWEPSKDWKHLELKLLIIFGFEVEVNVTNYIRLVMGRAVGLKKIVLHHELPRKNCHDFERICQVDEASRRRVKEQVTQGSVSPVEIIIL